MRLTFEGAGHAKVQVRNTGDGSEDAERADWFDEQATQRASGPPNNGVLGFRDRSTVSWFDAVVVGVDSRMTTHLDMAELALGVRAVPS